MELDRISTLPDSLLTHILSYLLIEDSVKTSVLSKRWEFLCLKVPVLDLTKLQFCLQRKAISWLILRFVELNRGSRLESFNIKCSSYNNVEDMREITFLDFSQEIKKVRYIDSIFYKHGVRDLIAEAIHRGVQHLEAHLSERMPRVTTYNMPECVYTSKTLVSLKLANVGLDEDPEFGASLPNLKMMHLTNIYYNSLLIIKMLISASPLLEDLTFDFPKPKPKPKNNDFRQDFRRRPYQYSPNTDYIFLEDFSDSPTREETDDFTNVPQCLISTLEYVKINRLIMKEENGIKLVNYFLENSAVLKKLTLSFTHPCVTNQELESYKKLLTSTKLSPTCQVIFD
ncbi:hypothetical protein CARUB_v10027744mg [Capsella rubella]|uniref:F-box domain-containing protein n=1 Tax=Capsella rubella TaxID=81985 RepID=R0EZY0_9BRAS|nr:putative F-box/FBD/LRR-repeat protein At5g44950 [Capsella rubella]EOA14516.1 hypothetical protein CARUB_v10027744mg [Capsella rubella]